MSTASAGQQSSNVHWLMLGEDAPTGWTKQAGELLEKALRGDIFRRSFLSPEPITSANLPYNRLMLNQCREYQDVRYTVSDDRVTGLLITRTPGQAKIIPERHYQDETKYFVNQYSLEAAKLSDDIERLDVDVVPLTLSSKDRTAFKGSTEILCLAVDPDSKDDIGTRLLQNLPEDQDYKVCVVEEPGNLATKNASDPNNAAYYTTRGFCQLVSLPLLVPKTHWKKGGKHDAIWLLRPREKEGQISGTTTQVTATSSEAGHGDS